MQIHANVFQVQLQPNKIVKFAWSDTYNNVIVMLNLIEIIIAFICVFCGLILFQIKRI
jgi:hypothetical protein